MTELGGNDFARGQQENARHFQPRIGHFHCDYCGFDGSLTADNIRAHAHCKSQDKPVPQMTDEDWQKLRHLFVSSGAFNKARKAIGRAAEKFVGDRNPAEMLMEAAAGVAYDSKADTLEHMRKVAFTLHKVLRELLHRIEIHDIGKLAPEEKAMFDEYTPKLKHTTYGSPEYKQFLQELRPALDHHYKTNRHHPEHFRNGILGMNLVDLIEMMCDWYASSMRHADGDPLLSIDKNQGRFAYSDELKQIFKNTMHWIMGHDDPEPFTDVYWESKKAIWDRAAEFKFEDIDSEHFKITAKMSDPLCMNTWGYVLSTLDREGAQCVVVGEDGLEIPKEDRARRMDYIRAKIPMSAKGRALQLFTEFVTEAAEETAEADERVGKGKVHQGSST